MGGSNGRFCINAAAGLYLLLRRDEADRFWERFDIQAAHLFLGQLSGWILLVIPFPILWFANIDFFGHGGEAFFRLMWLFWWLVLGQAVGFSLTTRLSWTVSFAFALLIDGVVSQIYITFLPVTNYPFSVGWSEASRFYYGSLLFSKSLYGVNSRIDIIQALIYLPLGFITLALTATANAFSAASETEQPAAGGAGTGSRGVSPGSGADGRTGASSADRANRQPGCGPNGQRGSGRVRTTVIETIYEALRAPLQAGRRSAGDR